MTDARAAGRTALLVALAPLAAVLFVYDALLVRFMTDTLNGNDFGKFYYSARAVLDGRDMYAPSAATELPVAVLQGYQFLNMNPPHFHLIVLPLARLPLATAVAIWMGVSMFCLAVSVMAISRELGLRWSPLGAALALVAALGFAGTRAVCVTGQVTFLLLLPTTVAWILARQGRWTMAGAVLGGLLSVKPFFLIVVPYLIVKRQWPAVVALLGTALIVAGLGVIVFGPAAYVSWYGALVQSGDWAWATMNASVLAPLARTLDVSPYFTPLVVAPSAVRVWVFAAAGVAVVTLASAWRGPDVDRDLALLLVGAQLISPLGWVYYLWLPLGPIAGWLWSRPGRPAVLTLGAVVAAVGLWWPNELTILGQPSGWATLTIGSSYFWGTLALWLTVLFGVREVRRSPAS